MQLQQVLRSIQAVADLPSLVGALGHSPLWEAVPNEAWNKPRGRSCPTWAVGQTGTLPWIAVESRSPENDAVRLAGRIRQRGKVAIVLALDCRRRRLGIAVAFDRSPGIELDLNSPSPESVASLSRLAGAPEAGMFAFAARVADALSTEPVGKRFFRAFKTTLDRMAAALAGSISAADRHGFVLLQLTRVLFLYFIQSKGWLAQRERFLAEEVDRCLSRGRRLQRDFLRPLFFGTLNQPLSGRSHTTRQFGDIPFLNGGLFEPHPIERRFRSDIPNPLWRDAFDGLFERFHFTVAEGERAGSVAPDMLGRVFEGVMDPDERRASGTFYTPAALVEQLVDAALVVHLALRMHCTEVQAERRLAERDHSAAHILDEITVLDPAVGSGAFLLGALDRLSGMSGAPSDLAVRKRRVLQRSLFGVDRNAAAVRLTELRLWLAVIADDHSDAAGRVEPLPNLDCLIRQGDSLFDPTGLELLSGVVCHESRLVSELSALRKQVITATGPEKRRWVRRLHQLETRALGSCLEAVEQRHRAAVRGYLDQARTPDLFGRRRGLDQELRCRLAQVRHALRELRRTRRRLAREAELPWFHYQSAFVDVFARGGFDIVLGNPPWLRSEAIPSVTRKQLTGRYRWWRGEGRCYGNSPDLAVAFLERGFELAAPGGIVAMLLPAKIATAGYGARARHALASSITLHLLANLTGSREASFDATVYPLALVANKSVPPADHRVRTGFSLAGGAQLRQSELRGGAPWVLQHPRVNGILAELERQHPRLSEDITCHLGVKTGLNHVYLNPPVDIEPQVLRWALRGRDIRHFRSRARLRLLWTHDVRGHPLSQLPPKARAYLSHHEPALRARRDYQSGPLWLVFRARPATARYRVVWPDLARQLTAAALTSRSDLECIPLNTCYLAPVRSATRAHGLAGWLNSTWIKAVAMLRAVPASSGFFRFNARVVNQLPLPPAALDDPALVQLGREGRTGKAVQPELDALVARHLGLSTEAQRALRAALDSSSVHCR